MFSCASHDVPKIRITGLGLCTNDLGPWTEEENSIKEVLDMILDWAVEDLANAEVPIHMYDEDGAEIPWEDITGI